MKKNMFIAMFLTTLLLFSCSLPKSGGQDLSKGGGTGALVKISTEGFFDDHVTGQNSGFVFFMASKVNCGNCSYLENYVLPQVAQDSNYSAVNFYYAVTMNSTLDPNNNDAELSSIHNTKVLPLANKNGIVGSSYTTPIIIILRNGKVLGGDTGKMIIGNPAEDIQQIKALIDKCNKK